MAITWRLVNPEGAARGVGLRPAARLSDLAGKRVGLAWNGKPGGDVALLEVAALLRQRIPDVQCIKLWEVVPESVAPRELGPATIQRLAAQQPDVVLVSQGD